MEMSTLYMEINHNLYYWNKQRDSNCSPWSNTRPRVVIQWRDIFINFHSIVALVSVLQCCIKSYGLKAQGTERKREEKEGGSEDKRGDYTQNHTQSFEGSDRQNPQVSWITFPVKFHFKQLIIDRASRVSGRMRCTSTHYLECLDRHSIWCLFKNVYKHKYIVL